MRAGVTARFVLLIASAAVAPLAVFGLVSIKSLQTGTEQTVAQGNMAVAGQVAQRIASYFDNNFRTLHSLGLELRGTQLQEWQQSRILSNHVLDFPEFREITIFDAGGRALTTSRVARSALSVPVGLDPRDGFFIAPPQLDRDFLPTTIIAVPLATSDSEPEWIVAELSLEALWRMVDSLRAGETGYALLVDQQGRLIAHGNPDDKALVAAGAAAADPEKELAGLVRGDGEALAYRRFDNHRGEEVLAAAAAVGSPDWTVIVEQPTSEAFGIYYILQRQLLVAIGIALMITLVVGWLWGRSFLTRIFALTRATRALAEGRMEERVALTGRDEIRELGDSFNSMADRLVELQEDVRKQERQAMFGRIAAGLVHDLSHPIQNIVNNCKLMVKMHGDADYREQFRRIVDRESTIIKRVLDDLRNIARPIPLERFPLDVSRTVADAVEAMAQHAETAGLTLRAELAVETATIEGDVFALGRVYRNLILNAIQATAPGGQIVAATVVKGDRVHVRIDDTGCGIPPERLGAVFEDFVTTKRRGLGLGLAISKKIVEQLGGRISVASEVGRGTTFVLDFPRARQAPMLVAG